MTRAGLKRRIERLEKRMNEGRSLREELADLCHRQWSGWMEYLYSKGTINDDGSFTIPAEYYQRWLRQLQTNYIDLPENEQESDRKEADKFLKIMGEAQRP